MVDPVGFEPTCSPRCKRGDHPKQSQGPLFLVRRDGFEPPWDRSPAGLQPARFNHSRTASKNTLSKCQRTLVDRRGVEPRTYACKAHVLPIKLSAQNTKKKGSEIITALVKFILYINLFRQCPPHYTPLPPHNNALLYGLYGLYGLTLLKSSFFIS